MARLALFLILPFLPGCLAIAYPSSTYTPQIVSLPPDTHAFKSSSGKGGTSMIMTGGERMYSSVEKVPVVDGRIGALDHAYLAYYFGGIPVSFSESYHWKLLLYRPGYELIEIPSRWSGRKLFESNIDQLTWTPAKDIDAQFEALIKVWPGDGFSAPPELREFVHQEDARLTELKALQETPTRELMKK